MKHFLKNISGPLRNALSHFESKFEARYPKSYKVYLSIKHGTSQFTKETLVYMKLRYNLSKDESFAHKLTWNQIEIYRQLPRDWKRIGPVIILSSFPFANYIVLPVAYFFPQTLLCRHFWSAKQKLTFGEAEHKKRMSLSEPILKHLADVADFKMTDNVEKNTLIDILNKIKGGSNVSKEELFELAAFLEKPIFQLDNLERLHLKLLTQLNDCRTLLNIRKVKNLKEYAFFLNQQDRLLLQEDLEKIPNEYIQIMSFERGIDAKVYSIEDMHRLLKLWFQFWNELSQKRSQNEFLNRHSTFLVHSKIFMANHLTNQVAPKLI